MSFNIKKLKILFLIKFFLLTLLSNNSYSEPDTKGKFNLGFDVNMGYLLLGYGINNKVNLDLLLTIEDHNRLSTTSYLSLGLKSQYSIIETGRLKVKTGLGSIFWYVNQDRRLKYSLPPTVVTPKTDVKAIISEGSASYIPILLDIFTNLSLEYFITDNFSFEPSSIINLKLDSSELAIIKELSFKSREPAFRTEFIFSSTFHYYF